MDLTPFVEIIYCLMTKKQISILIGQFHASRTPVVIYTLLGSCVAVCLFDPVNRIGGMNHILLPGKADMEHFDVRARYGINAMELLINKMMSLDADRRQIVAKVFGGAHVISAISSEFGIGLKNVAFVLEFCRMEGIKVISQSLGGCESRKIFFHTDTGDVFLKRVGVQVSEDLIRKERNGVKCVEKDLKKPGNISLFYEPELT